MYLAMAPRALKLFAGSPNPSTHQQYAYPSPFGGLSGPASVNRSFPDSCLSLSAFGHPCARHDLLSVPVALAQEEVSKASHVARREPDRIRLVRRLREFRRICWRGVVGQVFDPIVFHADRPGDAVAEGNGESRSGHFLENRAESVEVPIVVVPEGAWHMAAAGGRNGAHARSTGHVPVINSRSAFEQHSDGCLLLHIR